jgi:hypothetical protein
MMFRVRCFAKNLYLSTSTIRSNCEALILQARPGKSKRQSSCSTPVDRSPCDDRAGGRSLAVARTFRCVDQGAESRTQGLVVSRPRASCDAGLLMPRCVSRASHTLADALKLAHSSSSHLAMLRRSPDNCASSLKDGHAPCSSFDAHVVLAFPVIAPAPVLRRSRAHPLRGPVRRPPPAFAKDVPRPSPSASTTKSS